MSKIIKTLLLSTMFLSVSAFSMGVLHEQIQEDTQDEEEFDFQLNEFGVTNGEYEYAINFYSILQNRGNWDVLIALVIQMDKDIRPKALNDFEYRVSLVSHKLILSQYQVPSNGVIINSPTKLPNSPSFPVWLSNL